jgi:hypothetical protein
VHNSKTAMRIIDPYKIYKKKMIYENIKVIMNEIDEILWL